MIKLTQPSQSSKGIKDNYELGDKIVQFQICKDSLKVFTWSMEENRLSSSHRAQVAEKWNRSPHYEAGSITKKIQVLVSEGVGG